MLRKFTYLIKLNFYPIFIPDSQYNVTVKHGWKLHETHKDKWYLLYAKTTSGKDRWLKALADERKRVREDLENGK